MRQFFKVQNRAKNEKKIEKLNAAWSTNYLNKLLCNIFRIIQDRQTDRQTDRQMDKFFVAYSYSQRSKTLRKKFQLDRKNKVDTDPIAIYVRGRASEHIKIINSQFIACSIKWRKRQVDQIKTHATITCQKSEGQWSGKCLVCPYVLK